MSNFLRSSKKRNQGSRNRPQKGSHSCTLLAVRLLWCLTVLSFLFLDEQFSFAWIYPEHRDITVLAVEKLDPGQRAILDGLWSEARAGEDRLCSAVADTSQAGKPSCIDWAAWPAISGDHSCSGKNLVETVLATDWILAVADIGARLKKNLAKAKSRSQRINYLRDSDIDLQRADQEYAIRAGLNNAHFLLARPSVDTEGIDYVRHSLREGSELNALGVYAWYHVSALEKASRLSRGSLDPEQRAALVRAALADEAFALHFLEDTYSSGHVAGTWGDASQRKGTHDYYNEHGLEVVPWKYGGKSYVLMGDAYMRAEDAERSADTARKSLEQVLDAAVGRGPASKLPYDVQSLPSADPFDVCTTMKMPWHTALPSDINPLFREVIEEVPVPGLGPGAGSLPRFRAELGPFIGLSGAISGRGVDGGFGNSQTTAGSIGSLEAAVRIGMGLEGVLNESGDGLVFLDLGIRGDTASTMKISNRSELAEFGTIAAAIPSRTAYTARLRMPFWLVPGDLILALPVLAISPNTYAKMAVLASNGGLIPWQSGIATPIGRFQFVLGREIGLSFYRKDDRMIIPPTSPDESSTLVSIGSTAFDFPILEYRPFRTFSLNQSSSLVLQLFSGFEVPHVRAVIGPPGATKPELKTIWYGGLRLVFDWRRYL